MVEKFDTVNQGKAAGPPFKDGQEAFIIYLASASILLNQNRFLYFAPSALVARGLFKIIINWPPHCIVVLVVYPLVPQYRIEPRTTNGVRRSLCQAKLSASSK
jgi:hypothetical protein